MTRPFLIALVLAVPAGCGSGDDGGEGDVEGTASGDASTNGGGTGGEGATTEGGASSGPADSTGPTGTTSGGADTSGSGGSGPGGSSGGSTDGGDSTGGNDSTGGDESTGGGTTGEDTTGGGAFACDGIEVFRNDFDDDAIGSYADLQDWNEPAWDNGVGDGRVEIVVGADAYSGRSLRVHYPQGGVGPSDGGAQWQTDLDGSYDELWLSYRVRFGPGFDFVLGGKLPGLVGGSSPTGCVADDTGFSARGMWRRDGNAVQYMYFPDKESSCGDDYPYETGSGPVRFEPGTWHTVVHHLRINTPGQPDGVLQAWVDGQRVLDEQDFSYRRGDGTYAIDGLYFSTFFGGSGAEWAPTRDEFVDYDDFLVCTGPIGE